MSGEGIEMQSIHHSETDSQRVSRNVRPLQCGQHFVDNTVINSRYTLLTFIPKNLFQQFRRPLNLYFLLVACLQFITVIAPVNPLSTLLPLLFAFTLTAVKEGYDDVKRHRADAEYNSRKFKVLDPETRLWVVRESCAIRVGDILMLEQNQEIPCDCICIGAPQSNNGIVYIRTDNLDGEIDLKPRDVVPRTGITIENSTPESIMTFAQTMTITCPKPSKSIDAFETTVQMLDCDGVTKTTGLSHLHLLLQSSFVKNTERLIAVVVYTGNETKCGQNKKPAPVKWAKVDQAVSRYSMIIFAAQIITSLTLGGVAFWYNRHIAGSAWYLGLNFGAASGVDVSGWSGVIFPLRFFLLTSVMIPISFKFVIDMSKAYMALVLEWDLHMWDEERGEGMRVKDSGIVENLAQIEYVLSDKTGTLTQNVMTLRGISVDSIMTDSLAPEALPKTPRLGDLWLSLALCNTVEIHSNEPLEKRYHAVSPDEEALCLGAATMGVRLHERSRDVAVIDVNGTEHRYRVVTVFAFTSDRRCMSIVVECLTAGSPASHMILTKGADDRIINMLCAAERQSAAVAALNEHVSHFAKQGLRTLVFARRLLTPEEVTEFERLHEAAMAAGEGRYPLLAELQNGMERDMSLVGATAVEDLLQVDVKETITQLLDANVGVWMLTGDKVETAQQIGVSCGLLPPKVASAPAKSYAAPDYLKLTADGWRTTLANFTVSKEMRSRQQDLKAQRSATMNDGLRASILGMAQALGESTHLVGRPQRSSSQNSYGTHGTTSPARNVSLLSPATEPVVGLDGLNVLVEGGAVLDAIIDDPVSRETFLCAAMSAKAVVCARVTPSQKAAITALVNAQCATTLAIGDGGNDVAMIQEAHVGVGIIGKEGQQAARAADFAITQFRFLAELMFVHGHMSYSRTCYVVQYSFYKSMLISFIQIVYNIAYGGLSGVSFWNSFFLTVWNGVFTLPQTLFYTTDRCAPRALLRKNPALYRLSQQGYGMTRTTFFAFILRGIVQSVGLLMMIAFFFGSYANASTGHTESSAVDYTVGYTLLIVHQVFTVVLESNSISPLNAAAIFGMPFVYLAMTETYSAMPNLQYSGVFPHTMTLLCWLFVAGGTAVLFLPHLMWRMFQLLKWPNRLDESRSALLTAQRAWHWKNSRGLLRWVSQWLTMPKDEINAFVTVPYEVPTSGSGRV